MNKSITQLLATTTLKPKERRPKQSFSTSTYRAPQKFEKAETDVPFSFDVFRTSVDTRFNFEIRSRVPGYVLTVDWGDGVTEVWDNPEETSPGFYLLTPEHTYKVDRTETFKVKLDNFQGVDIIGFNMALGDNPDRLGGASVILIWRI